MNAPNKTLTETEALEHADRLLHGFFAAETPRVWPPAPQVRPAPRRAFALSRSHLALAASFFVAIGCWWGCGLGKGAVPTNLSTIHDGREPIAGSPLPPGVSPSKKPETASPLPRPIPQP